jgi:hypothetical protein
MVFRLRFHGLPLTPSVPGTLREAANTSAVPGQIFIGSAPISRARPERPCPSIAGSGPARLPMLEELAWGHKPSPAGPPDTGVPTSFSASIMAAYGDNRSDCP